MLQQAKKALCSTIKAKKALTGIPSLLVGCAADVETDIVFARCSFVVAAVRKRPIGTVPFIDLLDMPFPALSQV